MTPVERLQTEALAAHHEAVLAKAAVRQCRKQIQSARKQQRYHRERVRWAAATKQRILRVLESQYGVTVTPEFFKEGGTDGTSTAGPGAGHAARARPA